MQASVFCPGLSFLPTPSHGGRHTSVQHSQLNRDFYPRPHMEGDVRKMSQQDAPGNFYPRPHVEGDSSFSKLVCSLIRFLPTPSRGGRRYGLVRFRRSATNFYPRPHVEGDADTESKLRSLQISTHALTWRATIEAMSKAGIKGISTHALTWRATGTTLPGGRLAKISTHALTWRATSPLASAISWSNGFLPTPSRGGRQTLLTLRALETAISTHALTWRATQGKTSFSAALGISTHALTWRATIYDPGAPPPTKFLPTPSRGGRHFCKKTKGYCFYFYPRPHVEGDLYALRVSCRATSHFYPRPHVEGDSCLPDHCCPAPISTHALTWRATL